MANDLHRDFLPVKDDCIRTRQGNCERIDHQSLSKLSRGELEDKVHRLLDEQTHLKKLSNSQEEKIKRLGTKLLRLINDKRLGGKNADLAKELEDLQLQYVELEHENYALKDKITVLRQQLASQSRHNTIRSPVRSNHTSPLMSMRQPALQYQNEVPFQTAKKTATSDVQLQEAEAHIKLLNNEIKSLHSKIEYLQQDLEKNSLDNRKTQVTENIEFIRLQRSLKQQAIQITALQEQIRNSENSQTILKEELLKAHNENDEALHVIAVKQNEILNLCSRLEEKNLNRLEENDLRQRINDLTLERDLLKERADLLMKTIEGKSEETEMVKSLKISLAQEKCKTKKLEEILGIKAVHCSNVNCSFKYSKSSGSSSDTVDHTGPLNEKKGGHCITDLKPFQENVLRMITYNRLEKKDVWTSPMCCPTECKRIQTEAVSSELISVTDSEITGDTGEKEYVDKIKMELEVQHLREMLRSQTCRCEAQQAEISRLMLELKLNEDKCRSTLQKLDKRLSLFETLELRSRKENFSPVKTPSPHITPIPPARPNSSPRYGAAASEEGFQVDSVGEKATGTAIESLKYNKHSSISIEGSVLQPSLTSNAMQPSVLGKDNAKGIYGNVEPKKRFVDQVFLESSDEDQPTDSILKKISSQKEIAENEYLVLNPPPKKQPSEVEDLKGYTNKMNGTKSSKRSFSTISSEFKLSLDLNSQDKREQSIKISIIWLDIDVNSSLWKNSWIKLLFIDFTFLDLRGESTETPESLPKPAAGEKCEFNFQKEIEISESRRKILQALISKPDLDLIIFKVVSDSEDFDQLNDLECEDVGVAVVTVKLFLEKYNKGLFHIPVKNTEDTKEVIGTLAVAIEITPGLFSPRS